MSIVNKIDGAIERMSNWKHNSQDWDAETFKYIEPVYEEIRQLEQRLRDAEEVIAFYANKELWRISGGSHEVPCFSAFVEHSKDTEWFPEESRHVSGGIAREYQKKYPNTNIQPKEAE